MGCVIDGCPPRLPLSEADMQVDLDRRCLQCYFSLVLFKTFYYLSVFKKLFLSGTVGPLD